MKKPRKIKKTGLFFAFWGYKRGMRTSKWTKKTTAALTERVRGQHNKSRMFGLIAKEMGLRPNSVRNFYYKVTCKDDKKAFKAFTRSETDNLLKAVLLGLSRGESVRSICTTLANGDKNKMLRFQNKYRAILAKDPARLDAVKTALDKQGYLVKDPVAKTLPVAQIIKMPHVNDEKLSDTDIANLFMGFVRLVRKNNESMIDKLKKEIERLKKSEAVRNS